MRTRFSSHLSARDLRPVPTTDAPANCLPTARAYSAGGAARRLTLALAASVPLCAGALLATPAQAAPTAESDENGPLVQIVKPGYNDVLKGKYRILIQVTARKYNPQSVEMFIDDQSATKGPMEISSFASSSYDFDTRLLTEGRHKLTVRVTDSQGFRGWSETTVFVNNKNVVDNQAPSLSWVGIKPLQEVSGSMKLEVNAADNFGVKMLILSVNPVDPSVKGHSWFINHPPYKVDLDTVGQNMPDGLYVLKALAFDSLEQQGEAQSLTIGVINNPINATKIGDMLEGQKQMANILAGKAPTEAAPTKATTPAKTTPAPTVTAPTATAPTVPVPAKPAPSADYAAPVVPEATTARSSVPTAQDRPLPPALNIPQATPTNPGIQLPRVAPQVTTPQAETPEIVLAPAEVEAPTETATNEVEAPGEIAPTTPSIESSHESSQPEIAPATTPAQPTATAETTATTETPTTADATATTETPATAETPEGAAVIASPAPTERTLMAKLPSLPIGQRNAGAASLSRAAAVDLAVTPASRVGAGARLTAPIEVARFSRPILAGRAVSDAPVWSQNAAGDDSRLSNSELSRARASKIRVLNQARPVAARGGEFKPARALQVSAPTLAERPILGRTVTPDSVSVPAAKLTREAQMQATPLAKARPATPRPLAPGALSKAVTAKQRLAPLAPQTGAATARATQRGAMSKAAPAAERAKPIELAPALLAKNATLTAQAPQLSAPTAPRMSESASGLGVPSKLSKAVQRPTEKAQAGSRNGERVAALPRPDAAKRDRSGASIVAVPLSAPLQIADATATPIPASYRAESATTLRAIAARFGLPVELIAISNGWTTETKVLRGTEVKLPRPLQVSYNGAPVKGDAPSMLMGDTAVTAFRFMFERTGGKLEWDAANQRVVARKDGRVITLNIGSNVAKVGDRDVMMEMAAFLFQGRTMVPLRFFEEGMNAQVEWNPQTGRIVVAMAG